MLVFCFVCIKVPSNIFLNSVLSDAALYLFCPFVSFQTQEECFYFQVGLTLIDASKHENIKIIKNGEIVNS